MVEELEIRQARREDIDQAAELIVRLKRLNGEFDPLFKVVEDAGARAQRYLSDAIGGETTVVLVAVRGEKVMGVLRAEVRKRTFYEPSTEGSITDFYILPEARRKALGNDMLSEASNRLTKKGASVITAEFPAQNEIAERFYGKHGFRALVNTYAREEESA